MDKISLDTCLEDVIGEKFLIYKLEKEKAVEFKTPEFKSRHIVVSKQLKDIQTFRPMQK